MVVGLRDGVSRWVVVVDHGVSIKCHLLMQNVWGVFFYPAGRIFIHAFVDVIDLVLIVLPNRLPFGQKANFSRQESLFFENHNSIKERSPILRPW